MNKPATNSSSFYDLSLIKQIPILDVCRNFLGLECIQRGGSVWCKAHAEKTPSTILHENQNTFHNFGTSKHGDVIELVASVMNVERKDAIRLLAQAYGISPMDQRKGLDSHELTNFEYAKIGLYGDLATKNFVFNVDKLPLERICEISEKYSMTMNELRKKHPKTYEKVLKQKALPFVRSMRNDYFLEVWSKYRTYCNIGNPSLFFRPDSVAYFSDQINALRQAERILERAVKKTDIKLAPAREYDPVKDLELLSNGKEKPVLGPASYSQLLEAAELANCSRKYRTVDYNAYARHMMGESDDLFYSAFLSSGRVVIGFLESDLDRLKPYFDKMRADQAKEAGKGTNTPAQTRSNRSASPKKESEPER